MADCRYALLITSLPPLGLPFKTRQLPLSPLQLERRLAWLTPGDVQQLQGMEDALAWHRLPNGDEAATIQHIEGALAAVTTPTLHQLVIERLSLRLAVMALRRRRGGEPPPPAGTFPPWGNVADRIRRHWTAPDLGLGHRYPWLPQAQALLAAGHSLALERLLFEVVWGQLDRLNDHHRFDLTAVGVYLLRWQLVDRWLRYQGDAAGRRFDVLVQTAMTDFQRRRPGQQRTDATP